MRFQPTHLSAGSLPAAASPRGLRQDRGRFSAFTAVTKPDLLAWAAIGVALSYVWRIHDIIAPLGPLQFPSLVSLLALWLYANDPDPRRAMRLMSPHKIFRIVAFLGVLTVLSVPTSVHDGASFRFITGDLWKNLLLLVVLAGAVRSFDDIRRFCLAMLTGGFIFGMHAYFNGYIGWDGRLAGMPYYDANDVGMILVGMMPLSLYFLTRGKSPIVKLMALVSLPLFLQVTILTGSRGAFLGMISVGLYFLFGFSSLKWSTRILAICSAVAVIVAVGSEQYWETINTLLNPQDDYNWSGQSETGRMEVWKRGMGYMLTHPLTGVGVNAFPMAEGTLSPFAQQSEFGVGFKWSAAHNSFVQIGAELGVFVLIAFTLLQVRCYFAARRILPKRRPGQPATDLEALGHALAGVVVSYVVCGFFLSQAYGAYSFAIYGLILGLTKVPVLAGADGSAAAAPAQGRRMRSWHPAGVGAGTVSRAVR